MYFIFCFVSDSILEFVIFFKKSLKVRWCQEFLKMLANRLKMNIFVFIGVTSNFKSEFLEIITMEI